MYVTGWKKSLKFKQSITSVSGWGAHVPAQAPVSPGACAPCIGVSQLQLEHDLICMNHHISTTPVLCQNNIPSVRTNAQLNEEKKKKK